MAEIECEQFEDFGSLLNSYVESDPQDALVLMVYREPHIKDCDSVADFYFYNPESHVGTVVEITMCEKKALTPRKKKQIANLSRSCDFYGLRLMVLYRDNIRRVFKHQH